MRRQELEANVIEKLIGVLPGRWEVNLQTALLDSGQRCDVLLRRQEQAGVVAVEFMSTVRIKDLLGRIALIMVQQGRVARAGQPLVLVIAAPRFGRRAVKEVERFLSTNAQETEWGLVDGQGTLRLRAPSFGLDVDEYLVPVRGESPSRHSRRLFSDLNRWMLKILLLRQVPSGMWGGPRDRAGTPTDLHRIAGVSTETAHRFVRTFEEHDYLRRTKNGLKLVRVEALLDAWMAAERLAPPKRIPATWFLGPESRLEYAFSQLTESQVIVGGFEACGRHGLLHTQSPYLEIHVQGNWQMEVEDWEIDLDDVDEPELFLVESPYSRSILGGCVAHEDLPTVDVLQSALDVVHSSSRGTEQAQLIVDNVLSHVVREGQ